MVSSMGKKYWETAEFRELAEKWEEKLEHDGLVDIEKCLKQERVLRQSSSNVYRQMEGTRREAKEIYFRELGKSLRSASFDSYVDLIVMTMRAEGAKIVEICDALARNGTRRYRRTVRLIIRKYENMWGIRIWRTDQLKYHWKKKRVTR